MIVTTKIEKVTESRIEKACQKVSELANGVLLISGKQISPVHFEFNIAINHAVVKPGTVIERLIEETIQSVITSAK